MPDFSDSYGGRFLNASHVTKPFVAAVVTVEAIEVEEGKKPKPVLFLEGVDRGVVLNKTRYDAMSDITGSPDTDDWCGRKVLVKRGSTNYAGKKVACVELEAAPASTGAALDDAIPF
jgi:hypothetical protein